MNVSGLETRSFPVVIGLGVALAYMVVATATARLLDLADFRELEFLCERVGSGSADCQAGAVWAGLSMCAGLLIALIGTIAIVIKIDRRAQPDDDRFVDIAVVVVGAIAALICGMHAVAELMPPVEISRLAQLRQHPTLFSLENLLWPLLLQLMVSARHSQSKIVAGSALASIAALSPYRAVFFAVIVFGILFPASLYMARRLRVTQLVAGIVAISLVIGCVFFFQTKFRSENRDTHLALKAIAQRVSMPLFQAFAVRRLSSVEVLPTIADGVKSKLRLSQAPSLDHFLYEKIYGSSGGGATSLLYGEGAANVPGPPILWIIFAALIPAAIVVAAGIIGVDVAVIAGIGIWRGSMGGIADVLPAMLIQSFAIAALSRVTIRSVRAIFFDAVLLALLGGSVMQVVSGYAASRHVVAVGVYHVSETAIQAFSACGGIEAAINSRANAEHVADPSVPTLTEIFAGRFLVHVAVTYFDREQARRMFEEIGSDIVGRLASCGRPISADDLRFLEMESERAGDIRGLAYLAILVPLAGLTLPMLRRRKSVRNA